MKLTLEQQYILSVLHSQYHACWCSGDFRIQGTAGVVLTPKAGILCLQPQKIKKLFSVVPSYLIFQLIVA